MQRRSVLLGAGTAIASAVAGCSGGGGSGGTTTAADGSVEVDLVNYKFKPGTDSPLEISTGTTVRFVWRTGGHDVHVDGQPQGANWQGHESIEDAGYSFEHTFDVAGRYHFWCTPHESLGMIGDIVVS